MAPRGKVTGESINVIDTAVVPLVGVVHSKEEEICRVIDSWQGEVLHCARVVENDLEEPSLVLRLDRTGNSEAGAQEHMKPLLLNLEDPKGRRREGDVWLCEQICKQKDKRLSKVVQNRW